MLFLVVLLLAPCISCCWLVLNLVFFIMIYINIITVVSIPFFKDIAKSFLLNFHIFILQSSFLMLATLQFPHLAKCFFVVFLLASISFDFLILVSLYLLPHIRICLLFSNLSWMHVYSQVYV